MSLVVSAALCAVVGGPLGCGSTPKHAEMVSATANAPASPLVDRDKCNDKDKHVVTADINQDKKPDVWKFFKTVDIGGQKTEVMTCKQTDLNLDGKIDMVNYYDDTGSQIVLEEIDGDLDGKFDMTVYYNQGKRVRDEIRHELRSARRRLEVLRGRQAGPHRVRQEQRRQGRRVGLLRGRQARSHRLRHERFGPRRQVGPRAGAGGRGPRRQRDACRARWRRRASARRRRDDAPPAAAAPAACAAPAAKPLRLRPRRSRAALRLLRSRRQEVAQRSATFARLALTPTLSRKRERESADPRPTLAPRSGASG